MKCKNCEFATEWVVDNPSLRQCKLLSVAPGVYAVSISDDCHSVEMYWGEKIKQLQRALEIERRAVELMANKLTDIWMCPFELDRCIKHLSITDNCNESAEECFAEYHRAQARREIEDGK